MDSVTELLDAFAWDVEHGGRQFDEAYRDLRRLAGFLMAGQPAGHTLQATALVNEAYLKLVGGEQVTWNDRRHFVNTVARAMRQILIDRARRHATDKHGGGCRRVDLTILDVSDPTMVELDQAKALESAVAGLENANARWGEVVHLRYFVGLTIEQTAELMSVSPALVKKDWKFGKAWLRKELQT